MPETPGNNATELTRAVKERAAQLGFDLCGVCAAVRPRGADRLDEWLAAGYAGQMGYLAGRREAYDHPSGVLDGARSVVMLGVAYRTTGPTIPSPGQGRVSRYAWGDSDYHTVVREKLHQLADHVRGLAPSALTRGVVDTAPLLERDFAQLAGLGWVGKNTLLINKPQGSWFFLAALLTDVELIVDEPFSADHCGACTACLTACPTGAFPQPYVLDASRCISYLTIELRDSVPVELREGMHDWLFGCDVCQDVCPWNRKAAFSTEPAFQPRGDSNPMDLAPLFEMDEAAFRRRFRQTPLWRAHRDGLVRNAAIVLGNTLPQGGEVLLAKGLADESPLVRGASAWALGRHRSAEARALLEAQLLNEQDETVRGELLAALADHSPSNP
ncbi:MAG: tRNA epoxyqueuosine(34) reductase QueG [Planctomycetales bacterium]|nr:tRNA epoxyqueuosine(34) reductase QueG [Planctomycetales bacterium]